METIQIILTLIGFILIMLGVIAIYDARKITEKWFSFSDKNEGTKLLKIGGFLVSIIGVLLIFSIKILIT